MLFKGELFAILTVLSWTACIFPFTAAARRLGPNTVNHYRLLLAVILLSLILLFFYGFSVSELFLHADQRQWMWFGLSGIVGLAIGDHFSFRMYAILGPRMGSLLTTLAPGAALLGGYLLLSERISIIGFTGIMITIFGIGWLALSKEEKEGVKEIQHGTYKSGITAGILAAACQGLGLVLAKKGFDVKVSEVHPVHATWIRIICATAVMFFISAVSLRLRQVTEPVWKNSNNGVAFMALGTVFGPVIGVSLSLYSVTFLKAGIAQTFFSLVPVTVLLASAIFYREKITARALTGVVLALAGVMILIWRDQLMNSLFGSGATT